MIHSRIKILLPLLFSISFAEPIETINPFADPSVILGNISSQEVLTSTNSIDSQNIEVSDEIINPFKDPSVILGNGQKEEISPSTTPSSSEISTDIINPFNDLSIDNSEQESYPPPSSNREIDLYSTPKPITDNSIKSDTPSYLRATNQDVLDAKALPKSPNENIYSNGPAPDIQGEYKFIEGTRDYGGNLKTVRDAYLVIEKLDDKNFGYYYTYILDKTTPYTSYGIFNYDKNRFNQRVITDEKFKTSNMDNVKITTDGDKLRMIFDVNGGTLNTLWESDMGGESFLSSNIKKSLESAKKDYIDIYKKRFPKLTY